MDLLIKDMDMPSSCQLCKLKRFAGNRVLKGCKPEVLYECLFCDDLFALTNKRQLSCKLKQLPTPHGRLIDADRLIVALKNSVYANTFFCTPTLTMNQIEQLIEHQPTIIDEEE